VGECESRLNIGESVNL